MKIITTPEDNTLYPELVARTIMDVRMRLGMSRLSLSYREILGDVMPVLVVDFFSVKGKLCTLRYNLPPDTPERTQRRVSLLLRLIRKDLETAPDGPMGANAQFHDIY